MRQIAVFEERPAADNDHHGRRIQGLEPAPQSRQPRRGEADGLRFFDAFPVCSGKYRTFYFALRPRFLAGDGGRE